MERVKVVVLNIFFMNQVEANPNTSQAFGLRNSDELIKYIGEGLETCLLTTISY